MAKDINRFSYSRFNTFQTCPRKHEYAYKEQIELPDSPITIPGKMFHECLEKLAKQEDITDTLMEFQSLSLNGTIELDFDLLGYIIQEYQKYYKNEIDTEEILAVEQEYNESLDEDTKDYMQVRIDKIVKDKNDYIVLRDIKTTVNSLKYDFDKVLYNQQLYLYIPYAEYNLNLKIDAIEIDEVRLAKLKPVPLKNNGRPSINKNMLDLVTYQDYYDKLSELGIEKDAEYQSILQYLAERGHPLFNRVRVQIADRNIIAENSADMLDLYKACKSDISYRVKSPLCRTCGYKDLCTLDYSSPDQAGREILIKKISKSTCNN